MLSEDRLTCCKLCVLSYIVVSYCSVRVEMGLTLILRSEVSAVKAVLASSRQNIVVKIMLEEKDRKDWISRILRLRLSTIIRLEYHVDKVN